MYVVEVDLRSNETETFDHCTQVERDRDTYLIHRRIPDGDNPPRVAITRILVADVLMIHETEVR